MTIAFVGGPFDGKQLRIEAKAPPIDLFVRSLPAGGHQLVNTHTGFERPYLSDTRYIRGRPVKGGYQYVLAGSQLPT